LDETKSASAAAETILVIDDDPMILNLVDLMLQKHGFSTLLAGDGQTGLEIFKENSATIDLILVDMLMPGMNGKKVIEEVLRLHPDCKIILLTGYATDLEELDGVRDIIQKPISLDRLHQQIRQVLDLPPQ